MSLISILKKKNKKTLFTTPSHSGRIYILKKFYQWYRADISEVDAINPTEALAKAEEKASKIYETKSTSFLTNGSTGGILASVIASCKQGDKLLIWKNSHPCHKNAGTLTGAKIIEYELEYNSNWGIYEALTPRQTEELLKKHNPKAIIVTSPSYEGIVSDIESISKICKKYGVYLIVDEAHGALYPFSDRLPKSAIPYADFTVQSLHKTAGGINPTALLHCNCELNVKQALALITTTSPSYPMLATIEANINFLNSKRGRKKIEELIDRIVELRSKLTNFEFYGDDVTKILIKKQGLSGYELSDILFDRYNIEDEKTNEKSTMLLTGIGTDKTKLAKLEKLKNFNFTK
ncbi:aminotransferase class I/II-fold pyridoxal phosphate-dependent enzyme [bacterium]|nr:aminotransferase class I/II-fold pyridoxal phosphate-dependent enzyme [bacterium]